MAVETVRKYGFFGEVRMKQFVLARAWISRGKQREQSKITLRLWSQETGRIVKL